MSEYAVSLQRSSGLSDEARRRRLHAVYSFLLSLGEKGTADGRGPSNSPPSAASDAHAEAQTQAGG